MIISIHLPKTAGTSFAVALETPFGANFFKNYAGLATPNCDGKLKRFMTEIFIVPQSPGDTAGTAQHLITVQLAHLWSTNLWLTASAVTFIGLNLDR
jgi:hypothetical protein